jgi:imidazolonepropionase-like amidohydrolase
MFEAAKAYHYGLTWQQAMRVVTINPAKSIELDKRIGTH